MQRHAELEQFKRAEAQTKVASCHVDWEFYCSATKKDWIISMTIGDTDSPTALIDTRVQEWNVIATTGDTSSVPLQRDMLQGDGFFLWYNLINPRSIWIKFILIRVSTINADRETDGS